ncbi:MAG TPA: PIN domain-containing protein [Anaerolineae bacterium]|nr:PIN domain-containing protein [Anaerolineae bacterium]
MHLLPDTNVLLDVLLERKNWADASKQVWQAHNDGRIFGYVTASTLTDIFYVGRRYKGRDGVREAVRICLQSFNICDVTRQTLLLADSLPGRDFEDNVQIACALLANLNGIVTRDKSGFTAADLPVWTPEELLVQTGAKNGEQE